MSNELTIFDGILTEDRCHLYIYDMYVDKKELIKLIAELQAFVDNMIDDKSQKR